MKFKIGDRIKCIEGISANHGGPKKGKIIHLRAAYQKINGEYTKTAKKVHFALKNKTAKYISLAPKHIFKYTFK